MKLDFSRPSSPAAIFGTGWTPEANADNSSKHKQDRDGQSQSATSVNDSADIRITAEIRRMVVRDDSFSMMSKNVKIVTPGGGVTLRGPVETEREKPTIESHAKDGGAVTNELEIKSPKPRKEYIYA